MSLKEVELMGGDIGLCIISYNITYHIHSKNVYVCFKVVHYLPVKWNCQGCLQLHA